MLARAYAQYIAHRSQNPALMAALDSGRNTNLDMVATQWEDDTFEPIAKEFDQLFDKKNWSNRS